MQRIDAHQHFWKYDPVRDSWITEDMPQIKKDFLPQHLAPLLQAAGFDGCVVVQSDQSEAENEFQLSQAAQHHFIKGVVGWVDFTSAAVEERLAYYRQYKKMKGFRHILQGESDRAYMLQPHFMNGIRQLKQHDFTYDILIYPDQLQHTLSFVKAFPSQRFVIDHMAKPLIKKREIEDWKTGIGALAQMENVYCKISGIVTEADWKHWRKEDFTPYLDAVVAAFGTNRIMYGSDWPVCLLAGSYQAVAGIVKDYFSAFSQQEQDLFFGGNASSFYNLQ